MEMLVTMGGQHVTSYKEVSFLKDANEFKWTILGTSNGEPPASPVNPGEIEMQLYDSGYNYDELCQAAEKAKQIDEYFREHCYEIFTGEDRTWRLWMVTICANRILFDYCRKDGNAAYCLMLKRPKMLGLRFFTKLSLPQGELARETTCLIYGDSRAKACRTQIEEFENGEMARSINLYDNGRRHAHKTH